MKTYQDHINALDKMHVASCNSINNTLLKDSCGLQPHFLLNLSLILFIPGVAVTVIPYGRKGIIFFRMKEEGNNFSHMPLTYTPCQPQMAANNKIHLEK